ncbi:MAG: electron transfer flavoprotein subunit alpha/FixB family protein [Dehalococcoidia bacterium]
MTDSSYGPGEAAGIWVFLEHDDGAFASVSLELVSKARELAQASTQRVTGLLLGNPTPELRETAAELDVDEVLVASHPLLEQFTAEPYAHAATGLIKERRPDILLLGATPYGRDLAGRLAVELRTGLTADCTDLTLGEDGLLIGEVTGFGGGVVADIKCETCRPQMATVRPGVFTPGELEPTSRATVEDVLVEIPESACPVRVISREKRESVDISRSERLVIAGRGTKGDMGLMTELAGALHAEIGATRVAVDEGWTERDRQIGQTGIVTRPELAVVCGVSGATQFTVGIEDAGYVVALNQDPEAPIFEHADLCIVDDLFPVLKELLSLIQSENGGAS